MPKRMSGRLKSKKSVNYAKANDPYKGMTFQSGVQKRHGAKKKNKGMGIPGRALSAPPLAKWPVNGQHNSVTYIADIDNDDDWDDITDSEVQFPFRSLTVTNPAWQGLIQNVPGLDADAKAQDHFAAITEEMRTNGKNTVVTECIGEAAAAICVLSESQFNNFKLIWGYDTHSGTGIDQIWRQAGNGGAYTYLIVEAKGPGAFLNTRMGVPTGYNQMEQGWIVNHLYKMDLNGHAAGQEIVKNMKLKFNCPYPGYGGSSTNYFGLDLNSGHKTATSKVFGMVVTAKWLSDGRLGYKMSNKCAYIT